MSWRATGSAGKKLLRDLRARSQCATAATAIAHTESTETTAVWRDHRDCVYCFPLDTANVAATTAAVAVDEYTTIFGYGAVQEREYVDIPRTTELKTFMVVATISDLGDLQYFAFVNMNDADRRLRAGDFCLINFDSLSRSAEAWTGVVTEPFPPAPVFLTTVLLFRPKLEGDEDQSGVGCWRHRLPNGYPGEEVHTVFHEDTY